MKGKFFTAKEEKEFQDEFTEQQQIHNENFSIKAYFIFTSLQSNYKNYILFLLLNSVIWKVRL